MKRPPKMTATPLPERIARARREGRTQQALELARQLAKQEPTPAHRDLVREVLVERGTQLQQQGHTRDASVVFANALTMGGSAEFRAGVAERMAACGDPAHALQALGADSDPKLRQRILSHVADSAVRQGAGGKNLLPTELHAGLDAVLQAFAHSEAGRDDETREALQTIGLTSPFLEWKLLVRGLLAYYTHDDARALDNWQRLDPQRLPARLALPLRFSIDPALRTSQPPVTQAALRQQLLKLGEGNVAVQLGTLREALANPKSLATAFRIAEGVVASLRRDRPALVPRLAHCFFWAVVREGQPEDVDRYRRVFGPIATDVEVSRLHALAIEDRGMLPEAHDVWKHVIKALEHAPDWPGAVGKRAQALVWERMGRNAANHADNPMDQLPFLRAMRGGPKPLEPGAAACYDNAIKLAPERLDPYLALFHLHQDEGKFAKAEKVGERLLKHFPEHAETSEALGDLAFDSQEPAKARDYYVKALTAQPLVHRLRGKLARARQNLGLQHTLARNYAAARAEYEAALALNEGQPAPLLAQWAVLEMKAGKGERAAELIARAQQSAGQRLAVHYALVSESVRAKLKPAERKRLAADLAAALDQPSLPAEVLALLEAAAGQRQRQLGTFRGQKTHEKTFVQFLDHLPIEQFTEADLDKLCGYLKALDARRPWQHCIDIAEQRFPENPAFPLSQVDYYLTSRTPGSQPWRVKDALEHARHLVQQLPREAQERYVPLLKNRQQEMEALGLGGPDPMQMLGSLFGAFGGPDGFDDDDDDEYESEFF